VRFELGIEVHITRLAVLGVAFRADGNVAALEIPRPASDAQCLVAARTRVLKEPEIIDELPSILGCAEGGVAQALHFIRGKELPGFLVYTLPAESLERERWFHMAVAERGLKRATDGDEVKINGAGCIVGASKFGENVAEMMRAYFVQADMAEFFDQYLR